jgi:adenylate kinase
MMMSASLANVLFFPFIAPPNGGKGTQTSILAERYGLSRIDMGSLLRQLAKESSPLAVRVKETLAQGKLVDLATVIDVLQDGIEKQLATKGNPDAAVGFILDGFPRSAEQTDALLGLCERTGATIAAAYYLDVPYAEIEARAANRRICADCGSIYNLASKPPATEGVCDTCGGIHLEHRVDDHPEKVQVRLAGFDADTLPILAQFEANNLLVRVNGNRTVSEITQELCQLVEHHLPKVTV